MRNNILDFGAVPDGKTLATEACQTAIDQVAAQGGGTVVCPAGHFLIGTILLKENVELHLENGCVLLASADRTKYYLPDDVTGDYELHALIAAAHVSGIALTGNGTIDGQCMNFFYEDPENEGNGEEHLTLDANVFRPKLLRFEDVSDSSISGVRFKNSLLWTVHLAGCVRMTVSGIRVENPLRACNSDAIDPDCCRDLIISDCFLQTGDDGVCVKSTRAVAERYGICENILIQNCIIHSTSSSLKIGTETFGPIRNIRFSNCIVSGSAHAIAVYSRDGGSVENITFSGIRGNALRHGNAPKHKCHWSWWGKGEGIFISATKRREDSACPGTIRNIRVDRVDLDCESSSFISAGTPDALVENILLDQCSLHFMRLGTQPAGMFDEQPGIRNTFPHKIPAFFLENVGNVEIRDSKVFWNTPSQEAWSEFAEIVHSKNIVFRSLKPESAKKELPLFRICNSDVVLEHLELPGNNSWEADSSSRVTEHGGFHD